MVDGALLIDRTIVSIRAGYLLNAFDVGPISAAPSAVNAMDTQDFDYYTWSMALCLSTLRYVDISSKKLYFCPPLLFN
jgi:hypothetical protein